MNPQRLILTKLALLCLCVLPLGAPTALAQGTAFTYQGRLNHSNGPANGVYDLRFILWDASSDGSQLGAAEYRSSVPVTNGLFTATLDFGPGIFSGSQRWLEIAVKRTGDPTFTALAPRQQLTAAPYSLFAAEAGEVASANIIGLIQNSQLAPVNAALLNGQPGTFYQNAGNLSSGIVPDARIAGTVARANQVWLLGGNAGTTAGVDYLGTRDATPLQLAAGGRVGWRLEPAYSWGEFNPNIIGGSPNEILTNSPASVIAGGRYNNIGTNSWFSAISGGELNEIKGNSPESAIGGGYTNVLESGTAGSTIAGGRRNRVVKDAYGSAIGGGDNNVAGGRWSTVPGGALNMAMGLTSFAAGNHAVANHDGTFVWADYNGPEFASTAPNQFLLRARGGVGINKNDPSTALDVNGTVKATSFSGDASGLFNLRLNDAPVYLRGNGDPNHGLSWYSSGTFAGANPDGPVLWGCGGGALGTVCGGQRVALAWNNLGQVGIGTGPGTSPGSALDVNGTVTAPVFAGPNDTQTLELKAGGLRVVRYQQTASGAPNVIAGAAANQVAAGVVGSTISGGWNNSIGETGDVLSGSIIGGGYGHRVRSDHAVIAGGDRNTIGLDSWCSVIAGGAVNAIENNAIYSVIAGGVWNRVAASYAFAAGKNANVLHNGTFVWADASTSAPFASSGYNQFLIRASGGVGINKNDPATALDVNGTVKATSLEVTDEARAQVLTAAGQLRIQGPRTVLSGFDGTGSHWFGPSPDDDLAFGISRSGPNQYDFTLKGGDFYARSFQPTSDRNAKENFRPIDPEQVLDKIAALPMSEWNFKGDPTTRHIGPMAQDFRDAFGLGTDDKHIATVDADGVALAAIQALNSRGKIIEARAQAAEEKVQQLAAENAGLRQELAEVKRLLYGIEDRLKLAQP